MAEKTLQDVATILQSINKTTKESLDSEKGSAFQQVKGFIDKKKGITRSKLLLAETTAQVDHLKVQAEVDEEHHAHQDEASKDSGKHLEILSDPKQSASQEEVLQAERLKEQVDLQEYTTDVVQHVKHSVMDLHNTTAEASVNQDAQLTEVVEGVTGGVLATDIVDKSVPYSKLGIDALEDVKEQVKEEQQGGVENWAWEKGGFLESINGTLDAIHGMFHQLQLDLGDTLNVLQTETVDPNTSIFTSLKLTGESILNVLGNILNLQLDDSAAAAERAREAARMGMGEGPAATPDGKADEAKAGGFFSKMGKAIMNPVGALGKGMKSVGKGISGFLKGLASGLAAFANPMVLIGVAVLSLSLPIFAAGLAAAFKVFDMIMGEGKALELITGIIESLGNAIGTILKNVLEGIGNMIKNMGPFITAFFDGLAVVIKAVHPIIVDVFKVIKDIITDPVLNKTIQEVLKTIQVAIKSVEKILIAFAPVIEKILQKVGDIIIEVADKIEKIVATIGSVISRILDSFDNIVNQIKPIIEQIGVTIETIINAIGDNIAKIGKSIEGVFTAIGDAVTKVIGGIEALIKTIGDTIVKVIDGIVTGIERLSGLDAGNMAAVAGGLVLLAGGLILFSVGAAVAGGTMPSKEALEGIAKSIERFGAIDSKNLAPVGTGMIAIGAGLAVFGVGAKVAGTLMPTKEQLESIAESVSKFGEIQSENLAPVGTGMKLIGDGLQAFGIGSFVASLLNDPKGLVAVADSVAKFGAIDATNFAMVGTGINAIGEGLTSFAGGGFLSGLSEGFGKLIGKSDPVEKFKEFAKIGPGLKSAADGISGLALAFKQFDDTDPEKAGKALNAFANAVDPAAMLKLKDSLVGLSAGELFTGGMYQIEPVLGALHAGGEVPKTGVYQLEKEEGVLTEEAMGQFSRGAAVLSSMQTGQELTELQRESSGLAAGPSTTMVITNNSSQKIEQKSTTMLPPSPIIVGNGETQLV